jgi:hypothetical protein
MYGLLVVPAECPAERNRNAHLGAPDGAELGPIISGVQEKDGVADSVALNPELTTDPQWHPRPRCMGAIDLD